MIFGFSNSCTNSKKESVDVAKTHGKCSGHYKCKLAHSDAKILAEITKHRTATPKAVAGVVKNTRELLEMENLPQSPMSIKVMTVNAHKGFTPFNRRFILPELRRAVSALSADMVFLQEVLGEHHAWSKRHADRWPHKPQYEFLADTIWHSYAYGRNAVYPNGHHGNALLSKYPIQSWENRDISLNGMERRGLLYSVIALPDRDRPLHTVCVHLSLREEHRQRQLKMLQALVQEIPTAEPLIVAGDFNDWLLQGHRFIEKEIGLHEVFGRGGHKPARTFPAAFPLLRLDRIYTRLARSVTPVVLPNRPWSHLSDHKPLLAEIIF